MMRLVRFEGSGQVFLSSRYGAIKARFNVSGAHALPISDASEIYTYQNANGVHRFSVCEGEGELNYLDYPKPLNFYALDLTLLDAYLVGGAFPPNVDLRAMQLVKEFLRVYDLNISKNALYLCPPFFKEVEEVYVHALNA
ncbi:hypothetical protein [Helicobacter ailurogastricus]|uniref:hypothetical protein n=1 Tax=Helicobacter ailurogastricus TaxID=1578720 RepID=UPI000CF0A0DF|nr:hypothetical protein [Helicobacter ailurogastricus]